ncbi:MAG: Exodeoxyribonuclease [Candidatus Omnitrophica bacterium ADurb.Bin292]|jgi:exodeoxyribonuclease-3|nr:MAG: Exodeoxyribonuclease [Candidatus Omnitrophica bacterium ADurb.Bin292]HPW77362.1 exodeoxyribonuclease III [Candidatus Omnitrophota bacterium]HQB11593.1 exodeoxyribonuclease III [Candidatus Omnitrophota bacterium]
MKILSWNVNGIRAVQKKGFLEWLAREKPDILGVQETKAKPEQLDIFLMNPEGYHTYWNSAVRPGYSGVALFTREKPLKVTNGFGVKKFDEEGRVITAEYPDFAFLTIYFPNGKASEERLQYKMDFYDETRRWVRRLRKKQPNIIVCGDYNTAHKEIDLARPKENEGVSGFLPIERAWMDAWVADGMVDIFREFHGGPWNYSWWDMKSGARERNVGWRIDYHFVTESLVPKVRDASILKDVTGSDHAPVEIQLK